MSVTPDFASGFNFKTLLQELAARSGDKPTSKTNLPYSPRSSPISNERTFSISAQLFNKQKRERPVARLF